MPLAPAGKQAIAASMYNKGKAFVGAAILLSRQDDSEHVDYVALHLFCQGVEIVLKGLLLCQDYDKYQARLIRPLGHNLSKIVREAATAYGRKPLRGGLASELESLSKLYSKHLLRYGSPHDILIDPRSIPRDKVVRYVTAMIRLVEQSVARRKPQLAE
jgi:hypothetical protein